MDYYILSVKRSKEGVASWWGPEGDGYTRDLREAGRYSAERVAELIGPYTESVAIPCVEVDALAILAVPAIAVGSFIKRSGKRAA